MPIFAHAVRGRKILTAIGVREHRVGRLHPAHLLDAEFIRPAEKIDCREIGFLGRDGVAGDRDIIFFHVPAPGIRPRVAGGFASGRFQRLLP